MDASFRRTTPISLQELKPSLLAGKRAALSKSITLIESRRRDDRSMAADLIDSIIAHTGKSLRLGITGVPGVGKSSFIEQFGEYLISIGKKVAVLTVDPSSNRSKGSILGDKTRMEKLSKNEAAFIRPSASGSSLGGVTSNTREAILLCEAAGYDVIIVETVGVGQSETAVKEMVDYFLLLMLAGGGDELQGIKRGIMEMADHILINKADKNNVNRAKQAAKEYQNAIHLFPPIESEWVVPVKTCSALENTGIRETWDLIYEYESLAKGNGWFERNRTHQLMHWFHERINDRLHQQFKLNTTIQEEIKKKEKLIASKKISVRTAVDELFD